MSRVATDRDRVRPRATPVERPTEGPDDRFEEFDKPETVEALAAVLRGAGHDVVLLGDGREFLAQVLNDPPDFVWNVAEGEGIGRCRESRVPAVLEMLGIPYSGSDPFTLAAALDKTVAKQLVAPVVAVPGGVTIPGGATAARVELLVSTLDASRGPWFVKPAFEGSSKGIRDHCLVETLPEAVALYQTLVRDYQQPILIEEFIVGEEVTVGLVGNEPEVEIVGTMCIRPKLGNGRFVYSIEAKRDWDARVTYEIPAQFSAVAIERLHVAALAAYKTLECRDLARIDFRIRDDAPYFLEANPLPGLAPDWSDYVILAKGMGISHPELIQKVLAASLKRVGLDR